MDCNQQGSSVHGILQGRILEWVAIPFSRYLPDLGIEPGFPALQADSLLSELPWGATLGLLNLNRLGWGDKILISGRSQMWNPTLRLTFLFIEIKTEPRSEVRVTVQGHLKAVVNTLGSTVGVRK